MKLKPLYFTAGISLAFLFTIYCLVTSNKPEARSYTITKELSQVARPIPSSAAPNGAPTNESRPMQALPGMADFASKASEITYKVPEGWDEFAPSSIRKANFKISNETGNAEVSITVFPGDVGGNLANVNRWRQQIGLTPIDSETLKTVLKPKIISNHPGYYVNIEGSGNSILGAILQFHGVTWFVKMQGNILTIEEQTDNFLTFLTNFKIEDTHH
tara:strand:+ start:157 stop:804 length:648 start_codon:yes stop_codon:yes gene_type:complete